MQRFRLGVWSCAILVIIAACASGCGSATQDDQLAKRDEKPVEAAKGPEPAIEAPTAAAPGSGEAQVDETLGAVPSGLSPPPELPHTKPERLFVTAGVGPLMCDVYILLDGHEPYEPVDRLVKDLLGSLEATDEPPAWQAVVDSPSIRFGQFGAAALSTDAARRQAIRRYDDNRDGLAQSEELRRFLLGGDWLTFTSTGAVGDWRAAESATWRLLDVDTDGVLSPAEIQAAPDRLRSRDQRGDEIISATEIAEQGPETSNRPAADITEKPVAAILSPRTDWEQLWRTMRDAFPDFRHAESGGGRAMNHLVSSFDKNQNGRLSAEELAEIVKRPWEVVAVVQFGHSPDDDTTSPVIDLRTGIRSWSGKIGLPGSPEAALISANQWLEWKLYENRTENRDAGAVAAALFQQRDKNLDHALDRSETEDAAGPLAPFEAIDLDANDKISPSELQTVLDRKERIENARFHMSVMRPSDRLFATLDVDHDGQLGAREIAGAAARLLSCDMPVDGHIHPDEIPDRTVVRIDHGMPAVRSRSNDSTAVSVAESRGPHWFVRMDANGDGDLSPREFLGSAERFAEFDANHDGFIDPREAGRAGEK